MPVEIKVTKEIGNFDPKFIGPFTMRQTIVFGICGAAAVGLYKLAGNFLPPSMQWYACIPPGGAAMLFNKPFYGMRFEQFLKAIFVNVFLAPTNRRYRTENTTERRIQVLNKACDEIEKAKLELENSKAKSKLNKVSHKKKQAGTPGTSNLKGKANIKSRKTADPKGKAYKMSPKAIR